MDIVLTIKPKSVLRISIVIIAVLVSACLTGIVLKYALHHDTALGFVPMFDMDQENSIPTLYSSLLLIISATILFVIASIERKKRNGGFYYWLGLGFVFLFLSVDEFVSIHERMTTPLREGLDLSGFLFFAWIIPYIVILIILAITYLPFLLRLSARVRRLMLLSAFVFLSGAVGMEMIGGYYFETRQQVDVYFLLLSTVEETLELLGTSIFIYALLVHFARAYSGLRIDIS